MDIFFWDSPEETRDELTNLQVADEFHRPPMPKQLRSTIISYLPGDETEVRVKLPRDAHLTDPETRSDTKENSVSDFSSTRQLSVAPGTARPTEVKPHAVTFSHTDQSQAVKPEMPSNRALIVLGPQIPVCSASQVYVKKVTTLAEYQEQSHQILTQTAGHKSELWLFHALLVDTENKPILDGQYVHENDLYQPLFNQSFDSVSVFQLVRPVPQLECKPINFSPPVTAKCGKDMPELSNYDLQFYRLELEDKSTWNDANSALSKVLSRAQDEPGLTAEDAVSQLTETCAGLKHTVTSGIPGRVLFAPDIPEALEVDVKQQHQQREASPCQIKSTDDLPNNVVQESSSSQESVPLEMLSEESLQQGSYGRSEKSSYVQQPMHNAGLNQLYDNQLKRIQSKLSPICLSGRNVAIGLIIAAYETPEWPVRIGAKVDNDLIFKISLRFQCRREDIHLLFDAKAPVTKANIMAHVLKFANKYQPTSMTPNKIFLFISAHGTKDGIVTSTGEIVSLEELLQPLWSLDAKHVVLIYEPCRGGLEHCAANMIVLGGISFASVDTAGSCLPAGMVNCSALYASMPLYGSYHADMGSLMLFALYKVADKTELTDKLIYLKDLAGLTQNKICALMHTVFPETKTVPIVQYTVRDECRIEIDNEIVASTAPAIPEARIMPSFKIRL